MLLVYSSQEVIVSILFSYIFFPIGVESKPESFIIFPFQKEKKHTSSMPCLMYTHIQITYILKIQKGVRIGVRNFDKRG